MSNPNEKDYWLCSLVYSNKNKNFRSIIKETFDEAKQWAIDEIRSTNREVEGFIPTYLNKGLANVYHYDLSSHYRIIIKKIRLNDVFLWSLDSI